MIVSRGLTVSKAEHYYLQGHNEEKLAECYYKLEKYDGLMSVVDRLPEGHDLLGSIAQKFATVGLCKQAVAAYTKTDMVYLCSAGTYSREVIRSKNPSMSVCLLTSGIWLCNWPTSTTSRKSTPCWPSTLPTC